MTQGTQKEKRKKKKARFGVVAANQSQSELNWPITNML